MTHEEILQPVIAVRSTHAVVGAGDHQQLEVLAGLDERIDQAQRRFRRDVRIHLADDQQQLALELGGVVMFEQAAYCGPTG